MILYVIIIRLHAACHINQQTHTHNICSSFFLCFGLIITCIYAVLAYYASVSVIRDRCTCCRWSIYDRGFQNHHRNIQGIIIPSPISQSKQLSRVHMDMCIFIYLLDRLQECLDAKMFYILQQHTYVLLVLLSYMRSCLSF